MAALDQFKPIKKRNGRSTKGAKIYVGSSPNSKLEDVVFGPPKNSNTNPIIGTSRKYKSPSPPQPVLNSPDQSRKARKRWKKVGNMAIAANRFKKAGEKKTSVNKIKSPANSRVTSPIQISQNKKHLTDEEIRQRARKNWKKAGNMAIAIKRIENAAKNKKKTSPGSSLSPIENGDNKNNNNNNNNYYNNINGKEEAILKRAKEAIRKYPGPKIVNNCLVGKGVHKVRWSEKLRGLSIITQNIVLGGRDEANNKGILKKYGVTHVLNVCKQLDNFYPDDFVYRKINCIDNDQYDIVGDFESAREFLKHVESVKGRCLVHCIAGVSRSVCMILMYMMTEHHICLNQIYKHIKKGEWVEGVEGCGGEVKGPN